MYCPTSCQAEICETLDKASVSLPWVNPLLQNRHGLASLDVHVKATRKYTTRKVCMCTIAESRKQRKHWLMITIVSDEWARSLQVFIAVFCAAICVPCYSSMVTFVIQTWSHANHFTQALFRRSWSAWKKKKCCTLVCVCFLKNLKGFYWRSNNTKNWRHQLQNTSLATWVCNRNTLSSTCNDLAVIGFQQQNDS